MRLVVSWLVLVLLAAATFSEEPDIVTPAPEGSSPPSSKLSIYEQFAIPSSQGWARCQNCVLTNTSLIAFHSDDSESRSESSVNESVTGSVREKEEHVDSVTVSWSLWSEFFHQFYNDRYVVSLESSANVRITHSVSRPVFIIPMITLHVGHILIDLLEQIYNMHMRYYGRIRKDCIIILDVAPGSERSVLEQKIDNYVNTGDGVGSLLRLLSNTPVQSIHTWDRLREFGNTIFSDLHIGADISQSFFNAGQLRQPCLMSLSHGNTETTALAQRYRRFAEFIRGATVKKDTNDPLSPLNKKSTPRNARAQRAPSVLIIERTNNRIVLNSEELAIHSSSAGYVTETMDLENVVFSVQQKQLAQTDVLVSVAGTALHNVLFMRPGSAVVMFMQPRWCEYAWMYANQAILLGIKPFIYCAPSTPPIRYSNAADGLLQRSPLAHDDPGLFKHYGWTRHAWLQGPYQTKSDNFTVDVALFAGLLEEAVEHTNSLRRRTDGLRDKDGNDILTEIGVTEDSMDRSFDPLICPGQSIRPFSGLSSAPKWTTVDVTAPDNVNIEVSSDAVRDRLFDVYISGVSVKYLSVEEKFELSIVGEIGAAQGNLANLLGAMPRLAICMEALDMAPWCYPLGAFNYYAKVLLYMTQPRQGLHFWAQVSKTGGKIRNSDVFIILDCRLPAAGFGLHTDIVGRTVEFELNIQEQCTSNDTTSGTKVNTVAQMLSFPTQKFGEPIWQCEKSRRVKFSRYMDSRLSLQRYTRDFCLFHLLTSLNCVEFIVALQRHIFQIMRTEALGLPLVQVTPTVQNPFFFMHVEKTAGTTLRSYISTSTVERGLKAIIPCHTTHCVVLAAPLHREVSNETTSTFSQKLEMDGSFTMPSTFATSTSETHLQDWSTLKDLRLIQPPRQDNSDVSVLAGHFDFITPYRSLPHCADSSEDFSANLGLSDEEWLKHPLMMRDPNFPERVLIPTLPQNPPCRVSCFTVGRHPVDRAISFYYQRLFRLKNTQKNLSIQHTVKNKEKILSHRTINELTPSELEKIAVASRQGIRSHFYPNVSVFIDEGMTDAACSSILGLKLTVGRAVGKSVMLPPDIPPSLYPRALRNIQQCVVGLQDRWTDTLQVLDTWFPWIDFSTDPYRKKMHLYSGKENRTTIRPELYEVLARLNPCDMLLYEESTRLFELQMNVLSGRKFF